MMNLIDFLHSPVAYALGWTLLHAVWQGFALVLPMAVVLHLLQNRSGALRYRVSVLTLLAQVISSIVTFFWYYEPAASAGSTIPTSASLPATWQAVSQALVQQTLPWHQQVRQFLESHLSQFVLVYLIGVAIFGIRLAGGWVYLQRVRKAAQPAAPHWVELTDRLRLILAIRPVIKIRESIRIAVPMVVGVLKPILLLPVGLAAQLSVSELEAVLAHELAHIKRHDYAVNLLQSIVEVLYFFHPALWWLSARVREEREHCCDDLAVQACGGNGRTLAQALARVEELRLAQTDAAPALAMAFATRRQQLLHRVRRVLGVSTRPVVSNGSLAGVTLATILLMSVSVYAIQQQSEPKPKPIQSHSTRRHKVDRQSEYVLMDDNKLGSVIWKGRKLSATRVATLQRELDGVMAGKLSLNQVLQPDRDILLTIIETNSSFAAGMDGLAKGLAQIDYNTIMKTAFDAANAAGTFPVNVDDVLEEVEKIDYNELIGGAISTLDTNISGELTGRVIDGDVVMAQPLNQRQMDSLSQLMAQRSKQMQSLQLQMEKLRFPVDELRRSQDVLNWRKDKLMTQRNALIEKHQRLLQNDGKQKLSQAEIEKQLEALQPEIKKLEGSMEELNKQVEVVAAKEEEVKIPIEKLQQEAERLQEEVEKFARQMNKFDVDHSFQLNQDLNINLNSDLNRIELEGGRAGTHIPRPAHPVIAPHPPKAQFTRPASPAPPRPLRGKLSPVAPAPPSTPRPAEKPTPVPKPDPVEKPSPAPKPDNT